MVLLLIGLQPSSTSRAAVARPPDQSRPGAARVAGERLRDSSGAEGLAAGGFGLDVDSVDVEVHPVLGRLGLGDALQQGVGAVTAVG
jgi:hypothetical protein